jgi:hypothetical protein
MATELWGRREVLQPLLREVVAERLHDAAPDQPILSLTRLGDGTILTMTR